VRFSKPLSLYYCAASVDLKPRILTYRSFAKEATRIVFKGYLSKTSEGKILYYRHSAFRPRFRYYEGAWYLEITPTYYFTWDGHRPDRYHEERLAKMKRLERNGAVLGQVLMWAAYLGAHASMFGPPASVMTFGELMAFDCDVGIDDHEWLARDTEYRPDSEDGETELPLFAYEN
jgi:hypothetical protein